MVVTQRSIPRLAPQEDFPALGNGGAYLNAAGIGLTAMSVYRQVEAHWRNLATQGTQAFFAIEELIRNGPRRAAAALLNAPEEAIAMVTSCTEAMNQFAWWVRPNRGQNIVVVDIDHPAVTYPWLRVTRETGAEVRFVSKLDEPATLSMDDIAALVDDNTAVISVGHVLWTTGYRWDLPALADLAHSHDAYLAVDAMQSAGAVRLDAPASGADFLTVGSYKWLGSQAGIAICYMRPELAEQMQPVLVGDKSSDTIPGFRPRGFDSRNIVFPSGTKRLEYASTSHLSRLALMYSIDYLIGIGLQRIEEHVQALCDTLTGEIDSLGGEVLTPRDRNRRGGIVTARFPGQDGVILARALAKEGIAVLPRLGGLRFSPHLFSNDEDISIAMDKIRRLIS